MPVPLAVRPSSRTKAPESRLTAPVTVNVPPRLPPPWRLSVPVSASIVPVSVSVTPPPMVLVPVPPVLERVPSLSKEPPEGLPPSLWIEVSVTKAKLAPARLSKVAPSWRYRP